VPGEIQCGCPQGSMRPLGYLVRDRPVPPSGEEGLEIEAKIGDKQYQQGQTGPEEAVDDHGTVEKQQAAVLLDIVRVEHPRPDAIQRKRIGDRDNAGVVGRVQKEKRDKVEKEQQQPTEIDHLDVSQYRHQPIKEGRREK